MQPEQDKKVTDTLSAPETTPPSTPTVSFPQPSNKKGKSKIFLVLLILLVAVAGCTAVYFFAHSDKEETAVSKANNTPIERVDVAVDDGDLNVYYPDFAVGIAWYDVLPQISEGLVRYEGYKVSSALATSWTNPDELTWEFELKSGVTFHNGTKMTASHVKKSIELGAGKEYFGNLIENVKSIEAVTDKKVRITTNEPDVLLLKKLIYFPIFDTDVSEVASPEYTTGPFTLKPDSKPEAGKLELVPYGAYHGPKPVVQNLVYTHYASSDEIIAGLESGKIDFYSSIVDKEVADKALASGLKRTDFDSYGTTFLFLDTGAGKPLANLKLRLAVRSAINSKEILDKTTIDGRPSYQLLTPALQGYIAELDKENTFSVENAKKLYTESAYAGRPLRVLYTSELQPRGPVIVEQLKTAGIPVEGVDVDIEDFESAWATKEYDMLSISHSSELLDGADVLRTVLDPVYLDLARHTDPELTAKLDQANGEFDAGKRIALLEEVNQKVYDQAIAIPLYIPASPRFYNPKFNVDTTIYPVIGTTNVYFADLRLK